MKTLYVRYREGENFYTVEYQDCKFYLVNLEEQTPVLMVYHLVKDNVVASFNYNNWLNVFYDIALGDNSNEEEE